MKKNLLKIFAIALLLAVLQLTGAKTCAAQEANYPDSPRDVVIQVSVIPPDTFMAAQKTAVPSFTLYGDGRLIYTKIDKNKNLQLWESKLSTENINQLLSYIEQQGFYECNENYLNLTAKNMDYTTITVRSKDESKSVKIYGFGASAYHGMLPRGLINIYDRLTNFRSNNEQEYIPEKIIFMVMEYKEQPPKNSKIEKWREKKLNLDKIAGYQVKDDEDEDPAPPPQDEEKKLEAKRTAGGTIILGEEFHEIILEDKKKETVLKKLKDKTLFSNPGGYTVTFFKFNKRLYKLAYRPLLPYE